MKAPVIQFGASLDQRIWGLARSRARGMAWCMLLVLLAIAGWAWWRSDLERQHIERLGSMMDAQRTARVINAPSSQKPKLSPESTRQLQVAVLKLNMPWSDIFNAIEGHDMEEVAIVSMEPDASAGTVSMVVEARSLKTLLAYARALSQDPAIDSARLSHHETSMQDPNLPVRLSLRVTLHHPGSDQGAER